MSVVRILQATTLQAATELVKNTKVHVTVEAEYGSTVISGTELTLAHHQASGIFSKEAGVSAPCNSLKLIRANRDRLLMALDQDGEIVIMVSHVDLDTIGGVGMILAQISPFQADGMYVDSELRPFWELAEFVDLNGPHEVDSFISPTAERDRRWLKAYWAWAEGEMAKPASKDPVVDISGLVSTHLVTLALIFNDNKELLEAGENWNARQLMLDAETKRANYDGVIFRETNGPFVNHLYGPGGRAVVCYNNNKKSVTVSLAKPTTIAGSNKPLSCRDLVQKAWGPEAGGHDGIAGSPRGVELTYQDAWNFALEFVVPAVVGEHPVTNKGPGLTRDMIYTVAQLEKLKVFNADTSTMSEDDIIGLPIKD